MVTLTYIVLVIAFIAILAAMIYYLDPDAKLYRKKLKDYRDKNARRHRNHPYH